MDFQLARNLSELSRAQDEIAEALLHIDYLSDYLNREIIMSAACSEATEQLVVSARATLVQVQNSLETQSKEGARRLRRPRLLSLPLAETAPPVHRRLMSLFLMAKNPRRLEDRAVLRKESPPVTDIPSPKLPFEAGCGVMMLREKSE